MELELLLPKRTAVKAMVKLSFIQERKLKKNKQKS
jgi:hypothetical protein